MTEKQICPRASEDSVVLSSLHPPFNGEMVWREDNTCSYCGSLHPDVFMARLEAGDVELTPTDKSYKVYVYNDGGELFNRIVKPGEGNWLSEWQDRVKFYFQHLNRDQQRRFIELVNEGKVKIAFPGYFYVLPFFCVPAPKEDES